MRIILCCPCCGASIRPSIKRTPNGGLIQYCPVCGAELD